MRDPAVARIAGVGWIDGGMPSAEAAYRVAGVWRAIPWPLWGRAVALKSDLVDRRGAIVARTARGVEEVERGVGPMGVRQARAAGLGNVG